MVIVYTGQDRTAEKVLMIRYAIGHSLQHHLNDR
jgi:hypothetical protein